MSRSNLRTRKPQSPSVISSNAASPGLTVSWDEIPEWQQDNEYILTGYRRVQNNLWGCAGSVFTYLHNETVNIHTHLIGAVVFTFFLLTSLPSSATVIWLDTAVFTIFLSSAVFCFVCSATFHAVGCHSKGVKERCHAFDYSGIVVLTVGSFFPCIYYGFYCEPLHQVIYLSGISLTGLGASWIVLNPEYSKPTHRGARTKVFIGLGLAAVFPVSHLWITHGSARLFQEMGFGWLVMSGGSYIFGALLYANRIPEKLSPGKFDIWFASHQIFHTFVVIAALAHHKCILVAYNHWHSGVGRC